MEPRYRQNKPRKAERVGLLATDWYGTNGQPGIQCRFFDLESRRMCNDSQKGFDEFTFELFETLRAVVFNLFCTATNYSNPLKPNDTQLKLE